MSEEITSNWPHIRRFLHTDASGRVDHDFHRWGQVEGTLDPAERATANEEWADYFQWQLARRSEELAGDHIKRHVVEEWTDSMTYCCRRAAARARGEDPGDWIPQHVRRPDLHAAGRAIVAEIIAELDTEVKRGASARPECLV